MTEFESNLFLQILQVYFRRHTDASIKDKRETEYRSRHRYEISILNRNQSGAEVKFFALNKSRSLSGQQNSY